MLLQALTAHQQELYASIQSQIEQLQEKQRQIQAFMQQLGSVESKMVSDAQMVQEAIASINEVCPDELNNYKELITGLFNSPIAQLPASPDNGGDDEPDPTPPNGGGEPLPVESSVDADFVEVEAVTVDPSQKKAALIDTINDSIQELPCATLKSYLAKKGLSVKGKKDDLIQRFTSYCAAKEADELTLIFDEIEDELYGDNDTTEPSAA